MTTKPQIFNIFPTTIYVGEVENHSENKKEFMRLYDKFDYEENEIEAALELIETHLDPDANIDEHYGEHDPILGSTLRDFAVNDSVELKEYMEEIIPDQLFDLAADIEDTDMGEILRLVKDVAESLPKYEGDDDFKYIIDAMFFYMDDYTF